VLEYKIEYSESTLINGINRWDKLLHSITRIGAKALGIKYNPFEVCPDNIKLDISTQSINVTSTSFEKNTNTDANLAFVSGFSFDANEYRFGGWSGFDIDQQGNLIGISDEGYALKATPTINSLGQIIGFDNAIFSSLKGQDGLALSGKMLTDAEDVTVLPNGQLAVSFERDHRILVFNDILEPAVDSIPLPQDMLDTFDVFTAAFRETGNRQYGNVGLESLTIVNGHILTVIEETLPSETEHRVYLQNDLGGWDNMYYQGLSGYGISSATTLPNGNVLFLERATEYFKGYEHYNCRIVELDKQDFFQGNHIMGKAWATFNSDTADNFESIFTYTTEDGKTYISIATDDNYAWSERNLLLNFEWTEQGALSQNENCETGNSLIEHDNVNELFDSNNGSTMILPFESPSILLELHNQTNNVWNEY
jgi:hypothetical protein